MTIEEITERILEAAAIERRMPRVREKPTAGNGYCLPWVHTEEDIRSRRRTGHSDEKLEKGDDPLANWRADFWDGAKAMPRADEVTRWEEVRQWFLDRLDDPAERRVLWAWAASKHGGKPFVAFCRREGIHVETGRRRKNRAIERISDSFSRRTAQHSESVPFAVLIHEAEIIYFSNNIEADAFEAEQPKRYTWRDDPSMKPLFENGRHSSRRQRINPQARQRKSA